MSILIKSKDTKKILKLRNILTILKERSNGYTRPPIIKVDSQGQGAVLSKKEQRSRWLAGDPIEFIKRIKKIQSDLNQEITLKESLVNIQSFQTDSNIFPCSNPFMNNRYYDSILTESDVFASNNPDRNDDLTQLRQRDTDTERNIDREMENNDRDSKPLESKGVETEGNQDKAEDLFTSAVYANTEPCQNTISNKLTESNDYVNPFIKQSTDTPPRRETHRSNNREHNPSYTFDHSNQIEDTFGQEYFYDDYESYPTYSNNKFDRASHPLALSMNIYSSTSPNDNKHKQEGRHSHHHRLYNSERSSNRLQKINKHYFLVNDDEEEESQKQKWTYTMSYMKDLKNWKMSQQSLLLPSNVLEHLDGYGICAKVYLDDNGFPIEGDYDNDDVIEEEEEDTTNKVVDEAIVKLAEQNKEQIMQHITHDLIKADIRGLLNAITIDNYISIKDDLISIVKTSQDNQIKFIEVLFLKAINEKIYSGIYARLCKDIDRWLTTKKEKAKSPMREHLILTCKQSFKEKSANYPLTEDRESLRNYLIGCVNFIAELINVQMISKKVGIQCIKILLEKYGTTKEWYLIDVVIVLLDKFASIIYNQSHKIRKEDSEFFKEQIDIRCNELEEMSKSESNDKDKDDKQLPSHIIYKIINLIHKKNNGWKPTLFEQSQILVLNIEDNHNGNNGGSNINKDNYNSNNHYTTPSSLSSRDYSRNNNNNTLSLSNSGNYTNYTNNYNSSYNNRNTLPNSNSNTFSNYHSNPQSNLRKSEIIQGPDIEYEEDLNPITDANTNEIYNTISKDIKDWITFIQNGNSISKYQWTDIENLYSKGISYMDQIVLCYIDAALEHFPSLKSRKAKNSMNDYFRVLIEYYSPKLTQKEVDGVVAVVIEKMKAFCFVRNNKNYYLAYKEILENVIYYLLKNEVMQTKDFDAFCKEKYNIKEKLMGLIVNMIYSVNETMDDMMSNFKQTKLYNENVDIINRILKY